MLIRLIFMSLIMTTTLIASSKTVVFDFGGVMTGKTNRQSVVDFLCETFQLNENEFKIINKKKKDALKNGMTDVEFWTSFAVEKRIDLPDNWGCQLLDVMKKAINPNLEMYKLVYELKNNQVQVAMLSNIDKRLASLVDEFCLYEPFSPCLLSCDIGVEKPDPEAYRIMLSILNLQADNIVFIDDRIENIEAAKQLGIDAILFHSTDQLKKELTKRKLY